MAKKIIAIVSLVLIGLIIATTITMANVKVDYGISYNNPDEVHLLKTGDNSSISFNEQQLKQVKKLISDASKTSSLNALFNGTLFNHAKVVEDEKTLTLETKKIIYTSNMFIMKITLKF